MLNAAFAALGLATCLALAVHMVLPVRWRGRLDAWLASLWLQLQARLELARHWRQTRLRERAANDEAAELIRRARRTARESTEPGRPEGEWEGNVYRPKAFGKSKGTASDPPGDGPGTLH